MADATIGRDALKVVDMRLAQGADNDFKLGYDTSDGATPPVITPVNLTGWSARLQVRDRIGGAIWVSLTSPSGITLGSDGSIAFTISAVSTESVDWSTRSFGVWDLELINPSAKVTRFVSGSVFVSPDVTRAS
jgi:hypothetical protein